MKRTILLLLFVPFLAMGQINSLHNDSRNYTGTASTDTLKWITTVTATKDSAKVKILYGITVNSPVASDSIRIWEGTHTGGTRYLATITTQSSVPAPFTIIFGANGIVIDSAYVVVKRKGVSDITLLDKISK